METNFLPYADFLSQYISEEIASRYTNAKAWYQKKVTSGLCGPMYLEKYTQPREWFTKSAMRTTQSLQISVHV